MGVGIAEFRAVLAAALHQRVVVQAWLGYGDILFAGFGDSPIVRSALESTHPMPPYELQTHYSVWTVERKGIRVGCSNDEELLVKTAAEVLIGLRVANIVLEEDSLCLKIDLDKGVALTVDPMRDEDVLHDEAWCLRMPDGTYWIAFCDGDASIQKGQ